MTVLPELAITFVVLVASWQWAIDLVGPVIASSAIGGVIGLVGLIFVVKRFLNNDFPLAMREVNLRLDSLHQDFVKLRDDLQESKMEYARLAERHDSLRGRVDRIEERTERLDDTASRRPIRRN